MSAQPTPAQRVEACDPADAVWRLFTSVMMTRKEQFPALAASFGLNPGAMHALLQLDPSEPQSMSSLAGAWKCDASNVTWLIDRLEENGLVERRAHPHDRRVRTVVLTRKGAKVRTQIEARMFEAPEPLRQLSARDLETLARILHKIVPHDATH
jgi:DNA-binding MarR family transcriptional regulator